LFANNEIYKPFSLNFRAHGVSGKTEQPAQNTMARGPMQLHRLHRLKAGPAFMKQDNSIVGLEVCLDSTSLQLLNVYMRYCCESNQRRSQGGCWRGSSTPLSDQNIDVYFL